MKNYLTLNEAAAKYGITAQTLKNWDKKGVIHIETIEKIKYVPKQALSQVMASPLPMNERALNEAIEEVVNEKKKFDKKVYDLRQQKMVLSKFEVKKFRDMFTIIFNGLKPRTASEQKQVSIMLEFLQGKKIDNIADGYNLSTQAIINGIDNAITQLEDVIDKLNDYDELMCVNKELEKEILLLKAKIRNLDRNDEESKQNEKVSQLMKDSVIDIEEANKAHNDLVSRRTMNILNYFGIKTLGQMAQLYEFQFTAQRGAGKGGLNQIKALLKFYNMKMGMKEEDFQ